SAITASGDRCRMARSSAAYPPCARYESRSVGSTRPKSVSSRGSPPSRLRISGEGPPRLVAIGSALACGRGRPASPAVSAAICGRPRRCAAPLLDEMPEVLGGEWPVHERVDPNRRSDGAGGDVGGCLEGERAIRRRLPGAHPEQALTFAEQRLASGEATRCAGADGDHVPLHGQKAEAAESRGAKDLRPVDDHPVADAPQRTFGEIAVSSLNCAEDGDQRLRPRVEPVDHLV